MLELWSWGCPLAWLIKSHKLSTRLFTRAFRTRTGLWCDFCMTIWLLWGVTSCWDLCNSFKDLTSLGPHQTPGVIENRIFSLRAYIASLYISHTYTLIYIYTHIHTYIHTYIRTYAHTYIHTYVHTYIHVICTCICICICICIYIYICIYATLKPHKPETESCQAAWSAPHKPRGRWRRGLHKPSGLEILLGMS